MHSPHTSDAVFLRRAIRLAESAARRGNHPFGAVLVEGGRVLLAARNTVLTRRDATRHAELNLACRASTLVPKRRLAGCTMYASTEPCAMCAAAIYWAGIGRVVFGCSAAALGRITGGSLVIPCRQILARGKRKTRVVGPLLEEEALLIHRRFWKTSTQDRRRRSRRKTT